MWGICGGSEECKPEKIPGLEVVRKRSEINKEQLRLWIGKASNCCCCTTKKNCYGFAILKTLLVLPYDMISC